MPTTAAPYEALADVYDLLTDGYAHERWLGALERLARAHGLRGRRVLDVACGTGSSFLALLDAGYEVTACDLSPAMARRAPRRRRAGRARPRRRRAPPAALRRVRSRHLPQRRDQPPGRARRGGAGPGGHARHPRARGLLVFDVNTFRAYRSAGDVVSADDDRLVAWRGRLATISAPGALAEVVVEVFERLDGDLWQRRSHRQAAPPLPARPGARARRRGRPAGRGHARSAHRGDPRRRRRRGRPHQGDLPRRASVTVSAPRKGGAHDLGPLVGEGARRRRPAPGVASGVSCRRASRLAALRGAQQHHRGKEAPRRPGRAAARRLTSQDGPGTCTGRSPHSPQDELLPGSSRCDQPARGPDRIERRPRRAATASTPPRAPRAADRAPPSTSGARRRRSSPCRR